MIKTQVQIPDALYHRAKEIAAAKEISFAEVVRRGLEYMASVHPPQAGQDWTFPAPLRGQLQPDLDHDRLRDLVIEDEVATRAE